MGSVALEGFGGGGGAALNFKVVPGLTRPETAAENTIWVETEKIGAWYFSATQPEGMQEWDVWFSIGTYSAVEFNALKKNGIQVYPVSAKQYVSGKLNNVAAMIYQGGEWVEWMREQYLYNAGDEFTDLTGGLEAHEIAYSSSNGYDEPKAPVITRNADSITIKHNSAFADKFGLVRFKNKIDLSKYRTLKFDGKLSGSRTAIYIWKSIGSYYHQNYAAYLTGAKSGEVSIDIPAGTGECYIGFGVGLTESITLNKMWLEV